MWSQIVDNTKEFTDLLPKTWLLVIKVCSGLKYGLDTGRLIFSVGRRRGSLGMVANLGNCCGFRWCLLQRLRLLWHLTDFAHHLTSEASIALLLLRKGWWIIFLDKYSDHACLKVHHSMEWLVLTFFKQCQYFIFLRIFTFNDLRCNWHYLIIFNLFKIKF